MMLNSLFALFDPGHVSRWTVEVLLFRDWNRFRNRIFSIFQKLMIPIPITIPGTIIFPTVLESIPKSDI